MILLVSVRFLKKIKKLMLPNVLNILVYVKYQEKYFRINQLKCLGGEGRHGPMTHPSKPPLT